jgi:hypothetical protein
LDDQQVNTRAGILSGDLHSFFGELLQGAAKRRHQRISPLAFDYISRLMVNFHQSENFFHADCGRFPVLADLLSEAMAADAYRRISLLKRLGDTSLMVSGYFRDGISKRGMKPSYYLQMGENAYSHLSDLSESENVFIELSETFPRVADLLATISEDLRLQQVSNLELLKLATENNSDLAREKLKAQGIHPLDLSIDKKGDRD